MTSGLGLLLALIALCQAACRLNGRSYQDGLVWLHKQHFNVTCQDNKVKVLNCVTDLGTRIALGTLSFEEGGSNYTCKDRSLPGRAPTLSSGPELVEEPMECSQGLSDYRREGFIMSCEGNLVLGCADAFGDLVKEGLFVGERRALWYCYVYKSKRRAKVERRGCFNGSFYDDPNDSKFHMKRGHLWRQGNYTLRCEDNGLQIYKCHISEKDRPHVGSVWFDRDNVLNFCQFN